MTVGVLVGSGPFVRRVRDDLSESGRPHAFFSIVEEGSEFPCCQIEYDDKQAAALAIRAKGVTQIFHAGTFTRLRQKVLLQTTRTSVAAPNIPTARQVLVEWERTLRATGIDPIWVWEVLPHYKPDLGLIGNVPLTSGALARDAAAVVASVCAHVGKATLDMRYGVSHAVVLEGDHILATEEFDGTDGLLAHVAKIPKNGTRTLMKVCTPGIPVRLDPPTIGRHTVENAASAGVSVIAIDSNHGVIVNREGAVECADSNDIALVGIEVPPPY